MPSNSFAHEPRSTFRAVAGSFVALLLLCTLALVNPRAVSASDYWNEPVRISVDTAPLFVDRDSACARSHGGATGGSAISWDVFAWGRWDSGDRFRIRLSDSTGKRLQKLIVSRDFSTGRRVCTSYLADAQGWINLTYSGVSKNFGMPIIGIGASPDTFPGKKTVAELQRVDSNGRPGYYAMPIPVPPVSGKERKIVSWDCFRAWASGATAWLSTNALRVLSYVPGIGGLFSSATGAIVEAQAPLYTPDGSVIPTLQWLVDYQTTKEAEKLVGELWKLRQQGKILSVEYASATRVRFRVAGLRDAFGAATDISQAIGEAAGIYKGASFACGGR